MTSARWGSGTYYKRAERILDRAQQPEWILLDNRAQQPEWILLDTPTYNDTLSEFKTRMRPIFILNIRTGNMQDEVRMSGRAGEKSRILLMCCSTAAHAFNLNVPDVMKYASQMRDLQELAGSR